MTYEGVQHERQSSLGLTHEQKDFLSDLIRKYRDSVLQTLAKSQQVPGFLGQVIGQLRQQI